MSGLSLNLSSILWDGSNIPLFSIISTRLAQRCRLEYIKKNIRQERWWTKLDPFLIALSQL